MSLTGRERRTHPGISDAGHLRRTTNSKIVPLHGTTGIHRGILMNSTAQAGFESASEADSIHVMARFCYKWFYARILRIRNARMCPALPPRQTHGRLGASRREDAITGGASGRERGIGRRILDLMAGGFIVLNSDSFVI